MSPNSFPDFDQLAGQIDLPNLLGNKVSWWLTSPGAHEAEQPGTKLELNSLSSTFVSTVTRSEAGKNLEILRRRVMSNNAKEQ